jgi:ubiquinone/menaquinone biosynthesis C-methylase UbiE
MGDSEPLQMGFYEDRILPHVIHLTMRQDALDPYRRRVVAAAAGRVLEIGVGSGLNLPAYPRHVTAVVGLDPSAKLLERARRAAGAVPYSVELIEGSAEAIPLDDRSVDTVLTSWTLCSIPDVARALREARRVLTVGGRLLFAEHGRSPDTGVARWQDRLTPVWKRISGGCHLNRPIDRLVEEAGFRIERLEKGYMTGPRLMTFMYEGLARPV